jgi:ABC-type Zn uptake system ZnuABC Zn-binding protein ZnuA
LGVLAVLALAAGAACGDDDGGDSGKVQVVTTLPLFADFVREVGGERVEVTSLVPAGADPHTWEPSPSDVKKVAEADIAFANGLDLEPSAIRLIEANLPGEASLVVLADEAVEAGVEIAEGGEHEGEEEEEHAEGDPHLWMDVANAKEYARIIKDGLAEVDPEGAQAYDENAGEYLAELDEAASYGNDAVDGIPATNRKLVTTHDAFGYYAASLGLEIVAVVVGSPGQETTPADIADLATAIEDQEVPAVFAEPQIDVEGRILEQAAKDAGVQVCRLYSDSLDDKVTSYIEMMRFNAEEIARCLGGDSGG